MVKISRDEKQVVALQKSIRDAKRMRWKKFGAMEKNVVAMEKVVVMGKIWRDVKKCSGDAKNVVAMQNEVVAMEKE